MLLTTWPPYRRTRRDIVLFGKACWQLHTLPLLMLMRLLVRKSGHFPLFSLKLILLQLIFLNSYGLLGMLLRHYQLSSVGRGRPMRTFFYVFFTKHATVLEIE